MPSCSVEITLLCYVGGEPEPRAARSEPRAACWGCCARAAAVLAGAKKREEIYQAFEQIYPVLKEFKKGGLIEVGGAGAGVVREGWLGEESCVRVGGPGV